MIERHCSIIGLINRGIREHVKPVAAVGADRLAWLLKELDSYQFRKREEAMNGLRSLGGLANPVRCKALQKRISPEVTRRVQLLLDERGTMDSVSG